MRIRFFEPKVESGPFDIDAVNVEVRCRCACGSVAIHVLTLTTYADCARCGRRLVLGAMTYHRRDPLSIPNPSVAVIYDAER